jgi:hypothetical protein
MEFETTKCWLKTFDSNKVIVEAILKRRLHKLVRVAESLIVECSKKLRIMTCGMKNSNMSLYKL